jgi:hypothetical protein
MKRQTTRAAAAVAVAAIAAIGPRDVSAAEARSRHVYGMVGFAAGQTVRLNVVNTWPPGPSREGELPPGPIRARLAVFDGAGRLLASKRVELAGGESDFLDLRFPGVAGDVLLPRVQIRAQVDVMLPPGPSLPPGPTLPPDPCRSTLEVLDDATARTSLFVSPAVIRGFNPQPDPPRELGAR